jgi:hypothetical protein
MKVVPFDTKLTQRGWFGTWLARLLWGVTTWRVTDD